MKLDTSRETKKRTEGLTLVELIVVITILGIFATIVAVRTGGWGAKARLMKRDQDMKAIIQGANLYNDMTGYWPDSLEEMVNPTREGAEAVLDKIPKDPWQNEYEYDTSGGSPTVTCLGRDGAQGGTDEDEDKTLPETEDY